MAQTATATTVPLDRWDLIADRLWQIPELGWAIAEANPDLAGYLFLPAGLPLVIPELRSLRRPLTAANPAREDDGEFPELPPDTPRPIAPPSGGGGSIVLPLAINQGGTGGVSAQDALNNLGAVALSAVGVSVAPLVAGLVPVANLPPSQSVSFPITIAQGGTGGTDAASARANLGVPATNLIGAANGIAPLDSNSRVPAANLPVFQAPITFPLAINQGGTGAITGSAGLSALGGIAASQKGSANGIAPLDSNGLVPFPNLPSYPTLTSLGAIPTSAIGTTIAPLTSGLVPVSNLPPYPTLTSLGGIPTSDRGATNGIAPLVSGLVPIGNLPPYPTLASLGALAASSRNAANGIAPLDAAIRLPVANLPTAIPIGNLPPYPTLVSLGGVDLTTTQTINGNKNLRGFTTLGDNIAIKQKFFSGTTAATQGATAQITHGIAGGTAKIISIAGIITYVAGAFVSMNSPQVGFSTAISGDNITINIYNLPSPGSANILSKPFVLLVEYIA